MFTVPTADVTKFLTSTFIPVRLIESAPVAGSDTALTNQWSVQQAAIDGAIYNMKITAGGTGYTSTPTLTITGDGTGATATATPLEGYLDFSSAVGFGDSLDVKGFNTELIRQVQVNSSGSYTAQEVNMAHFAKIDSNNTVTEVIVAEQDFINSGAVGDSFLWIQTSYNKNFRKNYSINIYDSWLRE